MGCGQCGQAQTACLPTLPTAPTATARWPCFRSTNGPVFDCQSSGKVSQVAFFSTNKWLCFRLTKTPSVTVMEFVSQYVDLKPTASGAIGLYPFHDDHHPSFGVNTEGNYWHCFAGCGGGSVIDFWMKWRKCDFTAAVRELAEMVL